MKAKISFETSDKKKKALDTALGKAGLTYPELFNTSVEEITNDFASNQIFEFQEITSLTEIEDSVEVFARLQAIDWAFTSDDTSYLTHDIHPYPAKFIPQIPRHLIANLSLRGELICDSFGGSGTTALEALLLGRSVLSIDVSPLAKIIGEAKTTSLTDEGKDCLENFLRSLLKLSANPSIFREELFQYNDSIRPFIPEIPNVAKWFHPNAVTELAYLRWRIENLDFTDAKRLARGVFSKSILKSSFQHEETRYSARERDVQGGDVLQIFAGSLSVALKKAQMLRPHIGLRQATFKTLDLAAASVHRANTEATINDIPEGELTENSVSLIVSSPPYPNATDYFLYHRFRLFWSGFSPDEVKKREIGSHLRYQKEATGFHLYLTEMRPCLLNMFHILKPGRYAVLVLGDAIFKGITYRTAEQVANIAAEVGFDVVGRISRPLHKTKRSFSPNARRLRSEELLVLRKPLSQMTYNLLPPPYKLWEYEKKLRVLEAESRLGCQMKKKQSGQFTFNSRNLVDGELRKLSFSHYFYSDRQPKELTWQAILENGEAFLPDSNRKDPKYATHGIHPYKGKFYPQLVKSLFNIANLQPGQRVVDPFCGSGTVLLESFLNGYKSYGFDLNPLAAKIARVKIEILQIDPYVREKALANFQLSLSKMDSSDKWLSYFSEPLHKELESWFPLPVVYKLGWVLAQIQQISEPAIRDSLKIVLSGVIREVSQQDPKDLRIRRRHSPIADAPLKELLEKRLEEFKKRLWHFSNRAVKSPVVFQPAQILNADCRLSETYEQAGIDPESIQVVVTSPPYATALPYIETDRLSLLLLFNLTTKQRDQIEETLIGNREITKQTRLSVEQLINSNDFTGIQSDTAQKLINEVWQRNGNSEVGFRRQNMAALLYLYFKSMTEVMLQTNKFLQPGGVAFFVIGNNKTTAGDKTIEIRSETALQEIGTSLGWELVNVIPISVTTENRHHVKNSITQNHIIYFRKNS